jgi:hypothetical protein
MLIGVAIVAAGIPFYLHWRRQAPAAPSSVTP